MIEFEIPGAPPLLLNARGSWRTREKLRKQWYESVHYSIGRQRPKEPWPMALGIFTRFCGFREPDKVNLASGFKWIEDALVLARVIPDDNPDVLESYYLWEPASPLAKKIRVQLIPVYERTPEPSPP